MSVCAELIKRGDAKKQALRALLAGRLVDDYSACKIVEDSLLAVRRTEEEEVHLR